MDIAKLDNVVIVKIDINNNDFWTMLRSDAHHDSIHCDRSLEKLHLDKAVERKALILDGGDLADAMNGRFDPRRKYSDVRPEYLKTEAYYNHIKNDLAEFYSPYARQWGLFARGNHEKSVLKNANEDVTAELVDKLNLVNGTDIKVGEYGGWIQLAFYVDDICVGYVKIRNFHGAGGDAPVTRGTIWTNRQAVYLPDADIVWNGHNHSSYVLDIKRLRLNNEGVVYTDLQTHIRTPGYKDDFGDGSDGWEVERGGVPKPLGCAWIRFWYDGSKICREVTTDLA